MFRGRWNIYLYIPNDSLEADISKIFDKLGVHDEVKESQVRHRLKDNNRAIIKLSNRKDSLQVLCVNKDLKSLGLTGLDFPFLYENLK